MRVSWVLYGSPQQNTGGYVYDRCVVQGLRAAGDEVRIVSLQAGSRRAGPQIAACLSRGETDVIVGDELCHRELSALFAVLRCGERRTLAAPKRVLLVHHLSGWENNTPIASERRAIERAHILIATSELSAARLAREYQLPVRVCIPGADRLALVPRVRSHAGPLRLLFVGTWTVRKGLRELLTALASCCQLEYRLTIVGDQQRDAAYTSSVLQFIQQRPELLARCRCLGIVSDAELSKVYSQHEVLVLPSSFEGYGMVLSEAAHAGLAVLSFNAGGASEAAQWAPVAELIEPVGIDALAAALSRWITERVARRQQLDAKADAAQVPRWDDCVSRFRAVLQS
jgi:glycosyltransferase involved in cell wall biosynthesis